MTPQELIANYLKAQHASDVARDHLADAKTNADEATIREEQARQAVQALVVDGESAAFAYEDKVVVIASAKSIWDNKFQTSVTILSLQR